MWADSSTKTEGFEKATVGTNYQSTVTISEDQSDCGIGWTVYYGTPSTNDKIAGSNSAQMRYYNNKNDRGYLQSTTAVEGLSNVAFKARVSNLGMKLTVSYSADGSAWTALATNVALEQTGASGVKQFSYDIPSGGKYIKIEVAEGSTQPSSGNIKLIIDEVVFTYTASTPDPEPQDKTFYLTLSSDWASWPAKYAMYYFKSAETSQNGWSAFMTAVEGETNMYTGTIPTGYDKMIMVRLDGEATEANWNNKWSQTVNLDVPTNDNNLFTVTSGGTGSECDGVWSKYDPSVPPTPAAPDSIFFVNVPGWDSLRVHLWDGTAAGTTWPGVEMTKLGDDDKINGYDVYKYVAVEGAYTKCIFSNNGKNQTADLTWTSGKYFYDGAWYAKTEIPEPIPAAVPLQGNIWKVVAETPVRAGSHYIDEALLKMDGVYATTLKPNTRTIAGEEFTHVIQVRTDGYPSADNLAGKEKSGSTSLIITAKENVDITLYYNRQALNASGTENDNKDLIVFDQAAIANKVTGTFTIDAYNSDSTYLNVTKKLALKKDHVYTVTASGTTLQLHGIKLEEHVPAMQIAGAWDVQEQAWVVNNMTLADNKLTASYEVELAKGDYEFKVLKDGAWLTKANDGAYGLHREWPGVAGVTDNAENNLKLTADAAGTYTFTWTFANDSIGITFPAPEPPAAKENLYLVPNQWAEGDAKIAAWTWSKDGSINAFTEFFAPKAEGNDTLVAEVLADADSIIFVRFNATATEPKWNGGEGYQWNQTPGDSIQWEKAVFTIVPSEGYYTNGTWDVYTPAQPRLADGFYLIGQKGWAVDSLNADLLFTANPDNAGEYQLTVNLVANQSIKVVSVANDAIVAWYPDGQDNDYTIDEAHAGLKTIYFKPTGDQAWADFGGYFYIEPNQGTGVENGLSDQVQSTKVVRNGQLFIIRDGKTYTVQGVEVK